MTPQFIIFEDLMEFLGRIPTTAAEEPEKESKEATFAHLMELSGFLEAMGAASSFQEPKQETTPAQQTLTGGSVNYYTVKVKGQLVECGDVMDALQLTAHEYNIFKEIWRTANARLGNGKPGHTALYGAEKVAYYANRILEVEKQKA